MKKFICSLLTLSFISLSGLILCACGKPASSPIEDFTYEFEDNKVTITGYTGSDLEIIVPDTIEERPVTVIGEKAFSEYDMTSIVIPEGVTSIEYNAFARCNVLEKITFPDTLKDIYSYESIGLDDTKWYEEQPNGALYINNILVGFKGDVNSLPAELIINDGTLCIADKALVNSNSVTSLVVPDGTKYIGDNAFYRCKNLKSVSIPESVEEIGIDAFGYDERVGFVGTGYDYISEPIDNFEIHGKSGSMAETYATENEFSFILE